MSLPVRITYVIPAAVITAASASIAIPIGNERDVLPVVVPVSKSSLSGISVGSGVICIGPGILTGPTRAFFLGFGVEVGFALEIGFMVAAAGRFVDCTFGAVVTLVDDELLLDEEPEETDGFVDVLPDDEPLPDVFELDELELFRLCLTSSTVSFDVMSNSFALP